MKLLVFFALGVFSQMSFAGYLPTKVSDGKNMLLVGADYGGSAGHSALFTMEHVTLFAKGASSSSYSVSCDSDRNAIAHLGRVLCTGYAQENLGNPRAYRYVGKFTCGTTGSKGNYLLGFKGANIVGELRADGTSKHGEVVSIFCTE
jgi:hypothetical protein